MISKVLGFRQAGTIRIAEINAVTINGNVISCAASYPPSLRKGDNVEVEIINGCIPSLKHTFKVNDDRYLVNQSDKHFRLVDTKFESSLEVYVNGTGDTTVTLESNNSGDESLSEFSFPKDKFQSLLSAMNSLDFRLYKDGITDFDEKSFTIDNGGQLSERMTACISEDNGVEITIECDDDEKSFEMDMVEARQFARRILNMTK